MGETGGDGFGGFFEAKKRFGFSILNYSVTSNHTHLLVRDNGNRNTIPESIQLIAGRTGQEFNQKKIRKGAYWEDRYHATAVETNKHLAQCSVYIDLNMVRAEVVAHPSEWPFCGYHEIQRPKERYTLIDYNGLRETFELREQEIPYRGNLGHENIALSQQNRYRLERLMIAYQYDSLVRPRN